MSDPAEPVESVEPAEPAASGWSWAEAAFPIALVGLGIFALVDATTITVPGSANVVGPRAFPYAVGALLVVTGIAVLVGLARGRHGTAEDSEDVDPELGTDWPRVAMLAASLLALVMLIEPVGWPIAATVLFGGAAWALGARPLWRPLVIGAVLAVVTQILFTQALGVFLPAGPFEAVPGFG